MSSDRIKHASIQHPILPVIAERWSPYRYLSKAVEREKLQACFEAARWAASSYNEQPWVFLVAERADTAEFQRMLTCLLEANQGWAKSAGVLVLAAAKKTFTQNGKPNRVALHDLGQAASYLALQAAALGLQSHQMAGINPSLIKQLYQIPDDYDPATAIAIGYPDLTEASESDPLGQRDRSPRSRKPHSEFVFVNQFGRSANL